MNPLQFLLKSDDFQIALNSHWIFGQLFKEKLLPRTFKNRPIWSHCPPSNHPTPFDPPVSRLPRVCDDVERGATCVKRFRVHLLTALSNRPTAVLLPPSKNDITPLSVCSSVHLVRAPQKSVHVDGEVKRCRTTVFAKSRWRKDKTFEFFEREKFVQSVTWLEIAVSAFCKIKIKIKSRWDDWQYK